MKESTKIPRVEDHMAPPPRVDPDKESKNMDQKLPSTIQTTPQSATTGNKCTRKLKELVTQRRRGHYNGNKYDVP